MVYKSELKDINNLKEIFRNLRNYFAGNTVGITRDEVIAQNIMKILFCKIYDEKYTDENDNLRFIYNEEKTREENYNALNNIFIDVKNIHKDLFNEDDELEFNAEDVSYIMHMIQDYRLLGANRDVISDAFEEIIGTTFRGNKGQFFTPRNIVEMIVKIINPQSNERILDPACGTGGFLAYVSNYMKNNDTHIFGIDKDYFVSKMSKIYLTLLGETNSKVYCENSLERMNMWNNEAYNLIKEGSIDVILSNPPFGAKIPVVGKELLNQYELGHVWKKEDNNWCLTSKVMTKQPPQILFIERIVQLLKDGGRAAIVLPDGIFSNPTNAYIWDYLNKYTSIFGVISLSHETFQPSTHTKTSVLFIEKSINKYDNIFMAIAKNVGHNKNGKEVYKINANGEQVLDDDTGDIAIRFKQFLSNEPFEESPLGFIITKDEIKNNIYVPETYWEMKQIQENKDKYNIQDDCTLISIKELMDKGIVEIKRGNEIGSQNYGKGNIPFIRTTDIVLWEIKGNKSKAITEEVYNRYKETQDLQVNDILFVNDGTFLIGNCAMVSDLDVKSLYQSHLRKIRVKDNSYGITPYYIFYLLNTEYVKHQIVSKTFIQATLSTLGNRLEEIMLPIYNDKEKIETISNQIKDIVESKLKIRKQIEEIFN